MFSSNVIAAARSVSSTTSLLRKRPLFGGLDRCTSSQLFQQGNHDKNNHCRYCSSGSDTNTKRQSTSVDESNNNTVRLSKVLSQYASNLSISRRHAERLIRDGHVTLAGRVITSPQLLVDWKDLLSEHNSAVLKVQGKAVVLQAQGQGSSASGSTIINQQQQHPKVWAVHKLPTEVVSENDPHGRPSLIERLVRGGVGKVGSKKRLHLKPIGRLDMSTEGLILVTSDGAYARQMELPSSQIHRVYRARVHGKLTPYKLQKIRRGGVEYEGVNYGPMQVKIERPRGASQSSTNTWVQVTCTEGKNRQIRNVFAAFGRKFDILKGCSDS